MITSLKIKFNFFRGVLIECRKNKPKVNTLTNHITLNGDNPTNQSELEANTCSRRQARENACAQVTIAFDFASDWLRKWRKRVFSHSQSIAMHNQSSREITIDIQLKTTFLYSRLL